MAIGGPILLSSCGERGATPGGDGSEGAVTFEGAKKTGKIKVGFANEAPYGFKRRGQLTGEAPEVAKAVLKNMGINEMEGVLANFDGLIPGVNAKKYAFVAAGMFINPARCKEAAFSIPDYQVGSSFLVPRGNPQGIKRFEDIKTKDIKIAVLSGAVERGYAEQAGVQADKIVTLDNQDNIFRAVEDGRVYGAALLDITCAWLLKEHPDAQLEQTPPFQALKELPGVGAFTFRKGEDEFVNQFNTELKKLIDNGEWLKIVEPFGFTSDNIPQEGLTTEKLCSGKAS
ncbi:MAG: ectoine/hydroxyectoine ABC transporter substrate-binding protein EhuB [Actinobacteria bacterium]|nr:ectoine/hydroxyectoine ABC transporter substrate-binding protein EhuB [Actinomycetota bacterium]